MMNVMKKRRMTVEIANNSKLYFLSEIFFVLIIKYIDYLF